jgi:protein TonB
MAAGKMPAPRYPMDARRRGEEGTVVVEFTVDASGRVIAAEAKQPSPWASLNREALRAVRSWKFPPGDVMKMQRPIVFKLR